MIRRTRGKDEGRGIVVCLKVELDTYIKSNNKHLSGTHLRKHMAHTTGNEVPWWEVELPAGYVVSKVKIYNRTNCCKDRILNVKVKVGNFYCGEITSNVASTDIACEYAPPTTASTKLKLYKESYDADTTEKKTLTLCEVKVYGETPSSAEIAAGALGIVTPFAYAAIVSGDCPSNGLDWITDRSECGRAGVQLGVENTYNGQPNTSGNRPRNCGTWSKLRYLHYNTQTTALPKINNYAVLVTASDNARMICKGMMSLNMWLGESLGIMRYLSQRLVSPHCCHLVHNGHKCNNAEKQHADIACMFVVQIEINIYGRFSKCKYLWQLSCNPVFPVFVCKMSFF